MKWRHNKIVLQKIQTVTIPPFFWNFEMDNNIFSDADVEMVIALTQEVQQLRHYRFPVGFFYENAAIY